MPCGSSKECVNSDENGHCAFEDLDHSVLQQPLNLGVTNVKQILKCIQSGSKEVKDIILNECNIIYECKACSGLFRSLANFMYHKRCYCKKHLCEDMLLFENFEEKEEETIVVNPEAPKENSEKAIENYSEISHLINCTVNLEKSEIADKMESSASKQKMDIQSSQKGKNNATTSDKAKAKSVLEKTENSMISRRTRNKNAQPAVKIISAEEPQIKCAKIASARIMLRDPDEQSSKSKSLSPIASKDKDGTITKISLSLQRKFPGSIAKNISQFPKVVFKAINSNPHAVYQSSDKKRLNSFCVKNKTEDQAKADDEKVVIVLKKNSKSGNSPASKSSEKNKAEMDRLNDFHLTRRKRLLSRSDCNVQELRCLTCKTQFMSLKTLYFHMLSLHSKKRLYYPCPFCKAFFVQMYGVTRHLIAIHNKTKEQINKMRDTIKKKSVWKRIDDVNIVHDSCISPVNYQIQPLTIEEKDDEKPKPDESKIKDEESDPLKSVIRLGKSGVTLHPCGKCGRVFGRKSSQVSHEKFCIMNATVKKDPIDDIPSSEALKPRSPVVSFIATPQKLTQAKSTCVLQITKPDASVIKKLDFEFIGNQPEVKLSSRPKRGAEKQMHKDFVNSQTLKWRSANRIDTNVSSKVSYAKKSPVDKQQKKSGEKNLEKKVHSFMNAEDLTCTKCKKKFSSYSNLRRHVAIHVGWTRFKCKYCDYQAYNKSQCWTHVQKSHSVDDEDDLASCIVNLTNCSPHKKISSLNSLVNKRKHQVSEKPSTKKYASNAKIMKKKGVYKTKNAGTEKKPSQLPKKEQLEVKRPLKSELEEVDVKKEKYPLVSHFAKTAKKEVILFKKSKPPPTITITKFPSKDGADKNNQQSMVMLQNFPKKEMIDTKKEKTQHIVPIQKFSMPDFQKDANYKSVTTSNPTTIILSKTIPSSTVQSLVTLSSESMSSPIKISPIRSSPRKGEVKSPEDKMITTLVTKSPINTKITPIQINLPARSNSIEETVKNSGDNICGKKEKLISEWFPKKDLSGTIRRDSAPLIIGLVPASNSQANAQAKNAVVVSENSSNATA